MPLETITGEEFDKRLDEANARREQELQKVEKQQANVEQLLSRYERTLDKIEARLDNSGEPYPALLRRRLNELAEKTAALATSL